jgi:pimeloyl-ACP methyl ester carboxylesterase
MRMRTRWAVLSLGAFTALASLTAGPLAGSSGAAKPLPDHQPAVPSGNPSTAFAGNGPYKPGVAYQTTPEGDTLVITYPVDPASTVGKPTYVINLLRWFTGSPTAPIPAGLPATLPTTLATDAYQNVPISRHGPFPLVLFSHGYGGYPEQSSFLTDHLASWGFVVVAPDHRSRDLKAVISGTTGQGQDDVTDLTQALAVARFLNAAPGNVVSHSLDLKRVAVVGHSAGGGAALTFAAKDAAVRTYVALAPAKGTLPKGKPGLIMQGAADKVVSPAGTKKLYAALTGTKRLILINKAGHNAFDDGCTIGAAQGGLVAFVKQLKLPAQFEAIATDGCSAPDVYPPKVWPLIDQAVTAQLRWGLGIDRSPIGLNSGLDHAFSGVTATVQAAS